MFILNTWYWPLCIVKFFFFYLITNDILMSPLPDITFVIINATIIVIIGVILSFKHLDLVKSRRIFFMHLFLIFVNKRIFFTLYPSLPLFIIFTLLLFCLISIRKSRNLFLQNCQVKLNNAILQGIIMCWCVDVVSPNILTRMLWWGPEIYFQYLVKN